MGMVEAAHRERFRERIARDESGAFATLLSWWLTVGVVTALDRALPTDAFLQSWPAPLTRLAVLAVLWGGAVRAYAHRSWRPVAFAVPTAAIGTALAWRVYGPFVAETTFVGWGAVLTVELAIVVWQYCRTRREPG